MNLKRFLSLVAEGQKVYIKKVKS